ncbi:MAG: hypothetical protein ACJA1A_002670 [Saprospiraceae bacterium]|jgi:hypothetical protein|tara:strand:+ start:101 stop:844 length:744 start_codon:yes stop_codon:yes gene_type:complete
MKLYITSFAIAISLLAFSCKSNKKAKNINKDEIRFSLKKSACFGKCPTYKLTVTQSGYATFEGVANTDKLGIYGKQISNEQFKHVVKQFEDSDFESFPIKFKSQIADLPASTIGYHNGEMYKEVSGKEERPEQVMQLQFLLEKIADSGDWILLQSQKDIDQTKKPEIINIYSEVIIEPIPGTLIPKWIESMDKYGVRLMKKIAPTLNLYLITYDAKSISAEAFLKTLKRDENIKSAEFNKKTSNRSR